MIKLYTLSVSIAGWNYGNKYISETLHILHSTRIMAPAMPQTLALEALTVLSWSRHDEALHFSMGHHLMIDS
jgi:hypothetical protein